MRTQLNDIPMRPRRLVAMVVAVLLVASCAGLQISPSAGPTDEEPTGDGSPPPTSETPSSPPMGGGGAPPGDLQETLPASQVYLNDTDPFALAPPDECDPARDDPGDPDQLNYFALREFPRQDNMPDLPEELQVPDVESAVVQFENQKGQRFFVIVSARDADTVDAYIEIASLCLEAFPIEREPEPLEAVDLGAALINTAGFSPSDLSLKRDEQLANGNSGSLAEVITVLGGDPGAALAAAISDAESRVSSLAGSLPPDAAATDVKPLLDELQNQPWTPFLVDPALQAQNSSEWAAILGREAEEGTVLVTFVSAERERGEFDLDVVYFAEDPPINRDQYRAYRAICSTWGSVQIYASKGSATVTFWRQTPTYAAIGSRYDAAGGSPSSWLSASFGSRASWDVGVRGWQDGSYYSLYGGWTEGTGGLCS